jgi:hypothetical protein
MLRHGPDDPVLGEPLCPSCFDYEGAVLWNAHVGRLWQRTTVLLVRHLARAGAMSERVLRREVRLSYVKVAEFQRRGLVHLHVVLRADGPEGPGSEPPHWVTPELLAGVVRSATEAAEVPGVGDTAAVGWGAQGGATVIGTAGHGIPGAAADAVDAVAVDAAGVAAYVAKYATKSSEDSGGLARRLGSLEELGARRVRPHVTRLVETAWALGARPGLEALRLRAHAHTFGYPGHFATKSRRYSTTFSALRAARAGHYEHPGEQEKKWRYAGRGYPSDKAAVLAEALARATAGIPRGRPRSGPRALDQEERPGEIPGAGNAGDGAGEPHGDGGVAR